MMMTSTPQMMMMVPSSIINLSSMRQSRRAKRTRRRGARALRRRDAAKHLLLLCLSLSLSLFVLLCLHLFFFFFSSVVFFDYTGKDYTQKKNHTVVVESQNNETKKTWAFCVAQKNTFSSTKGVLCLLLVFFRNNKCRKVFFCTRIT